MIIFYLGYLLPMLFLLVLVMFFDEEVKIVKDLLEHWWVFVTPVLNIFFIIAFLFSVLYEFKKRINFDFIKECWDKFINIKFKKL